MSFVDFIDKYYIPSQKTEIYFILNNLCIYSDIETSLNDFYSSTKNKNKIEIISQFTLTCREFVITIYKSIHNIIPNEQKAGIEQQLTVFTNYLISDTYQISGLSQLEYFGLLKQVILKTYKKNFWDFSVLETWLNPDHLKALTIQEKKNKNRYKNNISKPIKLDWQGNMPLDLFIYDLTKIFNVVKCKKQVYNLFDQLKADFKIDLPSTYLLPFLTLFYELHKSAVIKVVGNRGLFVFLSQHLQAPLNDSYPKRDFRKIRQEGKTKPEIKKNISGKIKPLLDKYCNNGTPDDSRTIGY